MQKCRSAGRMQQECRNAEMQECRNAGMRKCRNAEMQEAGTENIRLQILRSRFLHSYILAFLHFHLALVH
jgi:hypothetical protein